ncbi:MAG: DUF362 domain-containing protein [Candidatus Altiarchaeales archaeon]|nr:DUF362 domain-containing protein [Candidatus Altiarchaeales archaeon]MBD3417277.1 DUF362 domain-containing protein [Candidatus Altiarchaeales archaeon]
MPALKVWLINKKVVSDLRQVLDREYGGMFSEGEMVAVKAHLGEWGNLNYVRPPLVWVVVDWLKSLGAEPFIFDTTTWYRGSRHTPEDYADTARKNGFTEETMGCPIIFSDESVDLEGLKHYDKIGVARHLHEADGMVVVSHVKGHEDATFGGAIKNLGMGAVDVEAKKVAHTESRPVFMGSCSECRTCEAECPYGAIKVEGKPVFDYDICYGCNRCVDLCPQKQIRPRKASVRAFLAEATAAVLSTFKPEKLLYVNLLMDASKHCDCMASDNSDFGPEPYPDIGLLVGGGVLAVDACTLDLIDRHVGMDYFRSVYKSDPREQLRAGKEFGLGASEYELVEA